MRVLFKIFIAIVSICLSFFYFVHLSSPSVKVLSNGVKIVDFSKLLSSKEVYESILCKKSAIIYVSTTLCVHDLNRDTAVSKHIWDYGVFEPYVLKPFMNYLVNNSDWMVFDIGAQVGQFGLFAAKLGRDVISVEPFFDNILRIHKAVRSEKLEKKFTLVNNALSNKRNDIKRLQPEYDNVGAQSLLQHRHENYTKKDMLGDKYLVETVLFDDLIELIPKRADGSQYTKAILKIDIEGFEPYAFDQAKRLFELFDFQVIFIEWIHLSAYNDLVPYAQNMIQMFTKQNLVPFDNDKRLNLTNWRSWPMDIVWKKEYL